MRDVTGFALLLCAVVLLLYLLVQVVLPFVCTWLLADALFFLAAVVLLRRGRVHPQHLDSYLKPGYAPLLAVLAVALPPLHALWFAIDRDPTWWPAVLIVNGAPPLLWTANLLRLHHRQKQVYRTEGHDLEDLLALASARDAALEVRADALETVSERPVAVEPWEAAAGADLPVLADRGLADRAVALLADVVALRGDYRPVTEGLAQTLREVRLGHGASGGAARWDGRLKALEPRWATVLGASESLLADAVTGRPGGWDEWR